MNYKKEVLKYYPDARVRTREIDKYTDDRYDVDVGSLSLSSLEVNEDQAWEAAYEAIKPLKQTCILKEELKEIFDKYITKENAKKIVAEAFKKAKIEIKKDNTFE